MNADSLCWVLRIANASYKIADGTLRSEILSKCPGTAPANYGEVLFAFDDTDIRDNMVTVRVKFGL